MKSLPSTGLSGRLARVRAELRAASLDAFVVTHLANLRYLTGFSGSAGTAIITAEQATLLVDFRYATAARSLVAADADLVAAVSVVVAPRSPDETLVEILHRGRARRIGIEGAAMSVSRFNSLSALLASATPSFMSSDPCPVLIPTERVIERARIVKEASEIATIREAARRLAVVSEKMPHLVSVGRVELEVAADIDALLKQSGFERPAFDTIVASGPNSALPHARPTRRQLQSGELVVLDFGGVYDGYCVDLTRTVQIGQGSPQVRRMFEAVQDAQQSAIRAVRPGVKASDVDAAARSALQHYGLADAFGHGTGHGIGLEVHEEPRIARPVPGLVDVVLEPGMIFTVEPGAYVEGVGGVRIEDDVLVLADGCEVLT